VEFLLDQDRSWYFLEVNTRIQVEHPVTELVYGIDLVQAQLELALGRWPAALGDPGAFRVPEPRGVALEARVLAEDPRNGFLPSPGPLLVYREPEGEGIRVDSGVAEGDRVDARFDSLLAKLIAWGPDRPAAAARLSAALEAFTILGCTTNLPLLQAISRAPDFLAGQTATPWIQEHLAQLNAPLLPVHWMALLESPGFREALALALRGAARPAPGPAERFAALAHPELEPGGRGRPAFVLRRDGEHRFTLRGPGSGPGQAQTLAFTACLLGGAGLALAAGGDTLALEDPSARLAAARREHPAQGPVLAPMAGKILEVRVAGGEAVEPGQLLFVLESMKMQFEIRAPRQGRVASVLVEEGQVLQGPEPLVVID
jgi:acetyl/propionyl-CoA carboxylase alpha subunit